MNAERNSKIRATSSGFRAALARLLRFPGRRAPLFAIAAVAGTLWLPAAAGAEPFGLTDFDVTFTDGAGGAVTQAGSHPAEMRVSFAAATKPRDGGGLNVSEPLKDLEVTNIAGFVGNPTAVPTCPAVDFLTPVLNPAGGETASCSDSSAVGLVSVESITTGKVNVPFWSAVFNLDPPPEVAAKLGFWTGGVPVTIELGVSESPPYNIVGGPTNVSEVIEVTGSELILWGVPADPVNDPLRGFCVGGFSEEPTSLGKCPANVAEKPFLTLPRACTGPLATRYRLDSWERPGVWVEGSVLTHDSSEPPVPQGMTGCAKLGFGPEASVQPTAASAESASGLRVSFDIEDEGISNPDGIAQADIAATELRLPAGVTVNPSAAEGLGVCTSDQFEDASLTDRGCPSDSKLGTLEVDTPVLENHTLHGSFYQAAQEDNPFDSLLAAYLTITDPELGIFVKLPAKIDVDSETGQIVTTVEDMPPFPLERVRVNLRSGPRAPLITPPQCGTYGTEVKLTPSSGRAPLETTSEFEIDSGPGGGPCPPDDLPFSPGFEAGSTNNAAAAYSPFLMRLTRSDGEQDLTRFSAVLPPGVTARLAGLAWCPDAAIAAAGSRDGRDELRSPSCPASSAIGRVVAGAGVGTALTYVDGSLYLAGPYNGAPLSVVAVVPAVAGPFDVGTVVTRVGLRLNPVTGQGEVDGAASDPIPHILEGIPLKVRDIRVLADRPGFTLNPTSCAPSNTFATIWGGGSHPFSDADDRPFGAASRFQAASCAALEFKPKLAIKLRGGVKRGAHPALRAVVTPKPGEANFSRAVVTLPRSAFLEQAHIRTICTRVQFNAPPGHGAHCPPGAQYGFARAWSPLLDAPAQGPVFLRSSNNNLPDLVVALKGPASAPVDVELSSRIDSVRGGIRSTFTGIPDLPVSRFILAMQGGKKGLIVNSRHLCHKPKRNRAKANLRGQNGRFSKTKPRVIAVTCAKRRKAKRKRAKRSAKRRAHLSRASAVGGER